MILVVDCKYSFFDFQLLAFVRNYFLVMKIKQKFLTEIYIKNNQFVTISIFVFVSPDK